MSNSRKMAEPAPPLNAPASTTTVKVSLIDTTLKLQGIQNKYMWAPEIKGFSDRRVTCGAWSFLIEHPSGRKLLYDLGTRKDWRNLSPNLGLEAFFEQGVLEQLDIDKNVSEILQQGGIDLKEIEALIWSHWHFDHTGDPSTFPSGTKLIVGEGFKDAFMPGYPVDPQSHMLESDFAGREVIEAPFNSSGLRIGGFKAFDYFGDGSFYILDSPGHAIGHVNALARTHASPNSGFIHMAGDSAHHAAEIRPSKYMPLPDSLDPSPIPRLHPGVCPGHFFNPLIKDRDAPETEHLMHFFDPWKDQRPAEDRKLGLVYDESELRETVRKDEAIDADSDVLTILAHDWSLKGLVDEWPLSLNDWKERGIKGTTRWAFLKDFEEACRR